MNLFVSYKPQFRQPKQSSESIFEFLNNFINNTEYEDNIEDYLNPYVDDNLEYDDDIIAPSETTLNNTIIDIQPTVQPTVSTYKPQQVSSYKPASYTAKKNNTSSKYNSNELAKIDIEDLLKEEGITQINNKKIKFGNRAPRSKNAKYGAKNSWHKQADPITGYAMARDISIVGGSNQDYADFRKALLSNDKIKAWFETKGWGIINEITPTILRRTGGTGRHFHFGPDTWARRTWKGWLQNPEISITQAL